MVSILIAAYQAGKFIPNALASVAAQTFVEWELILVEDGSNDGTEEIVKAFSRQHCAHRVIYENLHKNCGVSAARNRLLRLSRGEALAFLDADDQWESEHISSLLNCLSNGSAISCSPINIRPIPQGSVSEVYIPTDIQIANPRRELFRQSFIQTCSCVMLPRRTIEDVGEFDESFRIGEDRDYWFRAFEKNDTVSVTTKPTCHYIKHSQSSMAKTLLVARQTVNFYVKHRYALDIPSTEARRRLSNALRIVGRLSRLENPGEARRAFFRAWKEWPLGFDLPLRAIMAAW